MIAALVVAATLLDVPWKAVPAPGVEMKLTQSDALQIDFDFRGRAGYAIARRDGAITLPDNFELTFRIKGPDAPRNSLEVKFVQGENVWWTVRREYDFPRDSHRVSVKKRHLEFAWGPAGPSPLPRTVDAIEIVITAGTGGKGTVWIDDVEILPVRADAQEIGGIVLEKPDAAGKTWIPMPDADARDVRADAPYRTLPPMRDDNAFFAEMAKHFRRGLFPRYLLGEQSYWTILGGTSGEEEEALFSEDGAVEAGHARFSVEPFLLLDGKLVTWNDVTIEQREGPRVVWKKHLTITPRYDNGTLKVRYEVAPNAKLLLAIRPFQVNTPWQFLNRTGGVVRIRAIDGLTVDADEKKTLAADGWRPADVTLPEAQVAGDFHGKVLQFDRNDVTVEIPLSSNVGRGGVPPPPPRGWAG